MKVRVLFPWALVACVGAFGCGGDDAGGAGAGDGYDYVVELPPVAGGRDDSTDADGDPAGGGDGDGDADGDDVAYCALGERGAQSIPLN